MAHITYTAIDRGELISGHSALTEYSFDFGLASFNRSSTRKQNTVTAINGDSMTTLLHIKHAYSIQTRPSNVPEFADNFREFLSSVAAGEAFTLDPFGVVGAADTPKAVKLAGDYSEAMSQGKYITFSFGVVEA